ncbi:RNA-binding protein [Hyphococcus flavus]|uniref:RNA-binding protein n=1 Tax=Hyphococcus flavus TaxID=1866326 RepID=A0AAE9ZL59_9PROT|nr:RNA-binding protein [Hyphococcus flavus]WDI32655.1 RNA-binding protein [Hyphococcus flavus]
MRCVRRKRNRKTRRPRLKQPHEVSQSGRRKQPERRCVATGEALTPQTGLRFVLSPDGLLAPDFSGKLPGRGAWLSPNRAALEAAVKKGAFSRSFKAPATAPEGLADRVEAGLTKAALSALGLARKAGEATTGFEKARAALERKNVAVLINARDAGVDGKRKLARLATGVEIVNQFAATELAAALGRDEPTVHVVLKEGNAAQRFLAAAKKLNGFRDDDETGCVKVTAQAVKTG